MKSPRQLVVFSFLAILIAEPQLAPAGEGFSIACEPTKVVIEHNGALVTNYFYRDEVANKPYFWPVIGPTGKRLSLIHI